MNKIYLVEYSTGNFEDYRIRLAGISDTLKGANDIRNKFIDLLTIYNKDKEDKGLEYKIDNYYLENYNADSITIKEYTINELLLKIIELYDK